MSRSSYPGRVITALLALSALLPASAQVTIYTGRQTASSTEVTRAPEATWTGLPMYDPLQLEPPAPPQPPTTSLGITIPPNSGALAAGPENDGNGIYLSIPQKGNFLGFSVELSVADSLMGSSGDNLRPEFLNYLANIYARAGVGPVVRVGGNTQDSSTLVPDGFSGGSYIEKSRAEASGPTDTPAVSYSPMLLYAMSNISSLVHAEWYFGLAFNESDVSGNWENVPVAAQYAESILGPYLKGMPLGNEPDLYVDLLFTLFHRSQHGTQLTSRYADHGKRQPGWGMDNYNTEWRDMSSRVLDAFPGRDSIFIGPSTCCSREGFGLADVLNSGWLTNNVDRISQVSVQRYPSNNCGISGQEVTPQDVFPTYLNHGGITSIIQNEYAADMAIIQGVGKEVVMLETNTAACGGFPGLSTSFGAAVWLVDWSLQLAQTNFSQALMHVGGQNVYYNVSPPFSYPSDLHSPDSTMIAYMLAVHSAPRQHGQRIPMDNRRRVLLYPRGSRDIWPIERFSHRRSTYRRGQLRPAPRLRGIRKRHAHTRRLVQLRLGPVWRFDLHHPAGSRGRQQHWPSARPILPRSLRLGTRQYHMGGPNDRRVLLFRRASTR